MIFSFPDSSPEKMWHLYATFKDPGVRLDSPIRRRRIEFNGLFSHGELAIARVSLGGEVVWSSCGRDIFTEGFQIFPNFVEVIDFNHEVYRIDIATGASEIVAA